MSTEPAKTWGVGETQVFEPQPETPEEQERLNHVLKPKRRSAFNSSQADSIIEDPKPPPESEK